jgi:hypothetical protein
MWRQIPWVANALTLQGGIEMLGGVALLLVGLDSETQAPSSFYQRWLLHAGPAALLVCGGLKAFAANRNRRFRGRGVGVAALWSAVPTATVWPCLPTALAILVYGSIVYRHPTSRQAFELGENGTSPQDIASALGDRAAA